MRLFAALEVPPPVARPLDEALAGVRERFDGLRWTGPDRWHLTVAFIGHTDEAVDTVEAALVPAAAAAPGPLGMRLGSAGRFGSRVLWLAVQDDPDGAVAALGEQAQERLAAAALPVDRRPVTPHLTLARSRKGASVRKAIVEAVPEVEASWTARDLIIYQSHLGGGRPARYEVLRRLPLGGG